MSASTTFEFTLAPAGLDAFGTALAAHVEPAPRDKVQADSPPAPLAETLRSLCAGDYREICLTLVFPADALLQAFQAENPECRSARPGHISVGCFWVGCKHVAGAYVVSFTSATRTLSELMQGSRSVKGLFLSLANQTSSGSVRVIDEWNDVATLEIQQPQGMAPEASAALGTSNPP